MKLVYFFIIAAIAVSCDLQPQRFKQIPAELSGIDFNNIITESDSFNILSYEYIYNGGGVGVSDFNHDGLPDIYFTGNMVSNKLYLNQGNLRFKDVTNDAGVTGENRWSGGVAIADVNGDGWDDIYICTTTYPDTTKRKNILYINHGVNAQGVPEFTNEADAYHVSDTSHNTTSAFFDFDNDGDLDLFLGLNKMNDGKTPNVYKNTSSSAERVDKLLRNDWDSLKGHPVFTDVSKQAGIIHSGFSLGVNTTDINQDGWPDIYVTNDYLSNDLLYINKKDGTFEDRAKSSLKHTSYSAMGNDVVDINNDGLPDIFVLDMLPEDNYRRKTMLGPNNYTGYINNEKYGYQYQYVRNTLQLNQGADPDSGDPLFSDISFMAGVSGTDWSWAPLVADFDNDGLRDIIITNGFPKDVTDRDFVEYNAQAGNYGSKSFLMQFIPSVKIRNYAYRNKNGLTFDDVTEEWGINAPSFSNGAAYADFDNDGDLDYVVNNINDKAFLFRNDSDKLDEKNNWLRIELKGTKYNQHGLGAKLRLYFGNGKMLYADHSTYRGYLSSVEPILHFGIGQVQTVDSVVVEWPGDRTTRLTNQKVNQTISIDVASSTAGRINRVKPREGLVRDVSSKFAGYKHEDLDFIDFNIQPLLFHKLSQYGPGMAVGDANGDNLEDIYITGSHGYDGVFFLQDKNGDFISQNLFAEKGGEKRREETGALFFDADADGDHDLYVASGGYEYPDKDSAYRHAFYENVKGVFHRNSSALPDFLQSGSCVRAADYDRDGDLDLFIGGRVVPHQYPVPAEMFLLRNESVNGKVKFEVANNNDAPGFKGGGLVCDALWTDFNNDGWVDLLVAGEWMSLIIYENKSGKLVDVSEQSGLSRYVGFWNSVSGGDFDNDGDIDYIAGNSGLNTLAKGDESHPVSVYVADFDNNQKVDMMPTVFFKDREGKLAEYPFFGRLDVQKELIKTKAKFLKHASFAEAPINTVLTDEQRSAARVFRANYFQTSYIENKGAGKFEVRNLPLEAQMAPIFGMLPLDFNRDGNLDILVTGNDFGTEVSMGRHDAFNGQVLTGDGHGNFQALTMEQSGICMKGDAKSLVSVCVSDHPIILSAANKGKVKAYDLPAENKKMLTLPPDGVRVEVINADGTRSVSELYYGSGFLSQQSRRIYVSPDTRSVFVTDFRGNKREIPIGGIL
jgi:enediyne biosynthesis protein E4